MPAPDAIVALVSGVPLAALGGLLWALQPRGRDQAFFAAFAVVWGVQIVLANLGRVLGLPAGPYATALLASYGLTVVAALLLARFAAITAGGRLESPLTWMFGLWAAAAASVFALAPDLVLRSAGPGGVVFGPLTIPLVFAPFFLAFDAALLALYAAYRDADPGSDRHRLRSLVLALALFVAYVTVRDLPIFLDPFPGLAVVLGAGVATTVGIAVHLVARPAPPGDVDPGLLAAFTAPAAVALLEIALARFGWRIETLGLWRLASVGVLAYALARHRLFDLDLRAKPAAGLAAAALAISAGAVVAVAQMLGGRPPTESMVPLLLGTTVAGASWGVRDRLGELLFPDVSDEAAYVRRRKVEVYRGHLERVLDRGGDPDALEGLRRELGISEREHEVMTYLLTKEPQASRSGTDDVQVRPDAHVADRYRIDRPIGEGAHGRVYTAWDEVEERRVVVKAVGRALYGGKAAELLRREAEIVQGMDHPHVIDVLDVLEGDREIALVMEHADEGSLAGLLERRGGLGLRRGVRLTRQVLAGLQAAHDHGIVHRDVKPENVLLRDGDAKVADFGIARRTGRDATGLAGGAAGTLIYMSPEQIRGDDVDPRTDVYACGILLHQAVTGRHVLPVAGRDDFQIRRSILEDPPKLHLDDRPAWLRDAVARALAKDPADRFPTAEAFGDALAQGTETL